MSSPIRAHHASWRARCHRLDVTAAECHHEPVSGQRPDDATEPGTTVVAPPESSGKDLELLIVVDGVAHVRALGAEPVVLTVGRGPDADVRIDHPTVSRLHAQ